MRGLGLSSENEAQKREMQISELLCSSTVNRFASGFLKNKEIAMFSVISNFFQHHNNSKKQNLNSWENLFFYRIY